ncbi:FkbM family methyltransferase [Spirosoma sp.]|uniref:FkbM family methyltransferase n=1 Tax=Spirosoma sp. TaxID=1899569 RepID=UPI002608BC1F|nr:FkbM family methyltransferase [Spirosoma sp.]MCX6213090.1 FkbM family methyltransferase [Spirosoma sp.]
MVPDLIIDVGMHQGQDTDFYLTKGFRVIGIDADIHSIDSAKERFKTYIDTNQFIPLHCAISDVDHETVLFNLSQESIWNSLNVDIANRHASLKDTVSVQSRTLASIFEEYGVPHYCKIDIEGYDDRCLQTLVPLHELPTYISVESECIGEAESISDQDAQRTLDTLHRLGYQRFKLVDQASLAVLTNSNKFYKDSTQLLQKVVRKLQSVRRKQQLYKTVGYGFTPGSSGPFGEWLAGTWSDYKTAKKMLHMHRHDYFSLPQALNYGFWCDWHATF